MLITDAKMFTPEVITALFHANEVIASHEAVSKLPLMRSDKTDDSRVYFFAVQYSDFRTQRHAPDHILLKISNKTNAKSKREVDFYERIVLPMKNRLGADVLKFPVCYDAYYDEYSDQFHLVLDDVHQEFKISTDNTPPTPRQREQLIDTLAYLHAYWWEHPLLDDLIAPPTSEDLETALTLYQEKLADIKLSVGKYLDNQHIDVLEKIAGSFPSKRKAQLLAGQNLTIIHNNLLPENIVYSPRETCILNWRDWSNGMAMDDLAMMIPFHWSHQLRQYQETPLLKRYYDRLRKQGVTDYEWDDLQYDYRASLTSIIGQMLGQWTRNKHASGHWRMMSSAIDSFIAMEGNSIYN